MVLVSFSAKGSGSPLEGSFKDVILRFSFSSQVVLLPVLNTTPSLLPSRKGPK